MRISSPIALFIVALVFSSLQTSVRAQTQTDAEKMVRPRVVTPHEELPAAPKAAAPKSVAPALPTTSAAAAEAPQKLTPAGPIQHLTPSLIQARISEAKRMLRTRPVATAMTTTPSIEFVTIAALDRETAKTHFVTMSKQTFLTKGAELNTVTSLGTIVNVRIIRANGVNTALTITTPEGKSFAPLTVEYPIEKGGTFKELAYYTSAHPELLSNDLVRSGQSYVRNMLDLAAKRLSEKGVSITPDLIDVAERLCVVEHVDHDRFRNENRLALYDEIYSLFALNELDTYRFAVSSAGAGGMVQMIPWAYNLQRTRYPGVALMPDFVTGMRNHGNALQAMLLYIKDTWGDLAANDEVQYALNAKLATKTELIAAGYNSNAAKLPTYLKRGGDNWRTLIPRETQLYLQIYKSFDSLVPLQTRASNIR
ncbi:MAG TPA: hypothetical protein VHQ94_02740 [Pyrinomonadaceae bacterium]|jgi:hypothetical protein|nr:hypothetical protein [Pyrinomonadaceae bacterium]